MPSRVLAALHTRRGAGIALTALVLAHTALNAAWLRYDEHVIRIDEEFHASAAQDYYFALTDPSISGLAARISAIVALESPYPPFAHVVGAIPPLFLGYCSDTVSFSATLCFVALILGIYLVARRIYSRPAALFAAAVTSLIPVLFAGSRYVALENVITALTVWGLYFLMASDGFRARRYIVAFGLVNGCAILTKPNAFVYYLLPAAAVFTHGLWLAWRARKPGGAMAVAMNGIICIGLTCAVALPWYLYHRAALEQYWMSEHKGGKTPFTFTRGEASETGGKILEDRIYNPALHRSGQKKEALPPPTPATATAAAAATAQAPAQPQTAEVQTAGPPTAKAAPGAWTIDLQGILTSREWGAYPLLVVNNGAFLPLTLLGLAGLLVSLWRRRGNGALWLIIAWFVGSYVLNTLLFRFINPRYAMPFIGVLGIGAAGLLEVLPGRKIARRIHQRATLLLLDRAVRQHELSQHRAREHLAPCAEGRVPREILPRRGPDDHQGADHHGDLLLPRAPAWRGLRLPGVPRDVGE
jgi:4-amino-4-deoxy-L-arabinose transferase-like glycosyltransferase